MKNAPFKEQRFRDSVYKALQHVESIINDQNQKIHVKLSKQQNESSSSSSPASSCRREVRLVEDDQEHEYETKFALAEFMTNTSIVSQMNAMVRLGLDEKKLNQVSTWVNERKWAVTLRFHAMDACQLLNMRNIDVSSSSAGPEQERQESEITEFHWKVSFGYSILLFADGDPMQKMVELQSRSTSTTLITTGTSSPGKKPPKAPIAPRTVHPPVDCDVTWFFSMISPNEQNCRFVINRAAQSVAGNNESTNKTPRRNPDIDAAVDHHKRMSDWARLTVGFFLQHVEKEIMGQHKPVPMSTVATSNHGFEHFQTGSHYKNNQSELSPGLLIKPEKPGKRLSDLSADGIFCPVVPVLEKGNVLTMADQIRFLDRQIKTMKSTTESAGRLYPSRAMAKFVSEAEASVVVICQHLGLLSSQYIDSVDYVEHCTRRQLLQSSGLTAAFVTKMTRDWDGMVRGHCQRIFAERYAPMPFAHDVICTSTPNHAHVGSLSINRTRPGIEPVDTFCRRVPVDACPVVTVPIAPGTGTTVQLKGNVYHHGWLLPQSMDRPRNEYHVAAKARPFHSFLLVIGTMTGPSRTVLQPAHACTVNGLDQFMIPLQTALLPRGGGSNSNSKKEAVNSLQSLSAEQQAFCKAVRSLQMQQRESNMLALAVIPIKPALEQLVGLPPGALTKQIQLTDHLLELLTEHNIPSEMIALDEQNDELPESYTSTARVAAVKRSMAAVMDVIMTAAKRDKEQKLKEQQNEGGNDGSRDDNDGLPGFLGNEESSNGGDGGVDLTPSLGYEEVQQQQQQQQQQQGKQQKEQQEEQLEDNSTNDPTKEDFSLLPNVLFTNLELAGSEDYVRATRVRAAPRWTVRRPHNASVPEGFMDMDAEQRKAFQLLDILSRSGRLALSAADVHVITAVSVLFENDIMGTVVQGDINPIAKLEKSALVLASTVHNAVQDRRYLFANDEEYLRCQSAFPALLKAESLMSVSPI